jgi:hypothetical protein
LLRRRRRRQRCNLHAGARGLADGRSCFGPNEGNQA